MRETYILRWDYNSWLVWWNDANNKLSYRGTYHGELPDFLAAMAKKGYNAMIIASRED